MKIKKNISIFLSVILFILISSLFVNGEPRKIEKKNQSNNTEQKIQREKNKKVKHVQVTEPIPRGVAIPKQLIKRVNEPKNSPIRYKNNSEIKFKKKYVDFHHKPYQKVHIQKKHFPSPKKYQHHIPARFIYRGLWIRILVQHRNGYYFYEGYPYIVYHDYLHRYSSTDPGSYDLVDNYTYEVYATFYGNSLKQSYDRCAELRDKLNNRFGEYRYFCAERFDYDPNYSYNWNPNDYPNWFWH